MNKLNLILTLCAVVLASCTKQHSNTIPDWPWADPSDTTDVTPTDTTAVGEAWTDVSADYASLPSHIRIFKAPATLQGQNAIAYIADVDLAVASFEVWSINAPTLNGSSEPLLTPAEVYGQEGKPSVVINAGFFYTYSGKSYSSSLAVSNSTLLSPNINYASQDWVTMYYPTRGVFLEHSDGTYETAWTYWKDASHHWVYQNPAQNSWSDKPLQQPSATFPEEGKDFEAVNGIGGGPVLIKGGEIINSYKAELFDGESGIFCDSRHPRTAIGLTADKHLVLFVCEGRQMTEGVPGFTTEEVANILKDYGCTEALNLDGGGSSLMLVQGNEMIKPSDGQERAVGSGVYIK